MNKLPDDVKQVIFEYFATTCKEIAVLELLNKQVWQPRLFQNNKQATFWQHLLTKKLCIPSTDQIHAKQILKKYHSHQFDLVADQDILDFINWVNDDRHYYEEEDIYLQLLGKDCQGKHALVLQTALAMGVQTNTVNKFFDIRDVPHVDSEQKLGPNLNTCYIVAFELHNMESFQIATNYLRTLQKQLYCIKLPAMLVGLQCSTPVNSTTTTGTNSSMAASDDDIVTAQQPPLKKIKLSPPIVTMHADIFANHIAYYLTAPEIAKCCRVCSSWYKYVMITNRDDVWQKILLCHFHFLPVKKPNVSYFQVYQHRHVLLQEYMHGGIYEDEYDSVHFVNNNETHGYLAITKASLLYSMEQTHRVNEKVEHPQFTLQDYQEMDAPFVVGQSKLFGYPDLPVQMEWPQYQNEPCQFVGQFNTSEMRMYDLDHLLPQEYGMLWVFVADTHDDHDLIDSLQKPQFVIFKTWKQIKQLGGLQRNTSVEIEHSYTDDGDCPYFYIPRAIGVIYVPYKKAPIDMRKYYWYKKVLNTYVTMFYPETLDHIVDHLETTSSDQVLHSNYIALLKWSGGLASGFRMNDSVYWSVIKPYGKSYQSCIVHHDCD